MPLSHSATISGDGALDAVLLGNADPQALDVGIARGGGEVRHGERRRRRILGIVAGHALQQQRAVLDRARERTRLVERAGKRHHAPARAAAVGRLQPDDAAERRRLADRAAGVGAGAARHHVGRDHGRRAARRAARHQLAVVAPLLPRVLDAAEVARHVRRAHGELVEVGLADHDRARLPQVGGHRALILRHEAFEDVRAGRGLHALGAEQVLDGERHAFEQRRPRPWRGARRRPWPSRARDRASR